MSALGTMIGDTGGFYHRSLLQRHCFRDLQRHFGVNAEIIAHAAVRFRAGAFELLAEIVDLMLAGFAMPADLMRDDGHALTDPGCVHMAADCVDHAGQLMTGDHRIGHIGMQTLIDRRVRAADTDFADAYTHLVRCRFRNRRVDHVHLIGCFQQ